jgi:primary-amine oxidase
MDADWPHAHHCPATPPFCSQGFLYVRTSKEDNEYAHPLDLVPLVDLNAGKVVHVDMYDEPAKLPQMNVNYHRNLAPETTGSDFRSDLKPINITQPLVGVAMGVGSP